MNSAIRCLAAYGTAFVMCAPFSIFVLEQAVIKADKWEIPKQKNLEE